MARRSGAARRAGGPPARAGLSPRPLVVAEDGLAGEVVARALAAKRRQPLPQGWGWRACAAGDVVDAAGHQIPGNQALRAGQRVFIHAAAPDEPGYTGALEILWRGEDAVVVAKPAGLATAPRGAFVARSVTVAARRAWGNDHVVPAHRLDRLTSGCLLLVTDPVARGRYQQAFARRDVTKTYVALTDAPANVQVGERMWLTAQVRHVPGELAGRIEQAGGGSGMAGAADGAADTDAPAAGRLLACDVLLIALEDGRAAWLVTPEGGYTHQIRATFAAAGMALAGDPLYGRATPQVGADGGLGEWLGLHAAALDFPTRTGRVRVQAPLPADWPLSGATRRNIDAEVARILDRGPTRREG